MTAESPGIDLIVVLFNASKYVPALIEGISGQTYIHSAVRLWFVDNGPDDGSLNKICRHFSDWPGGVVAIPLSKNLGFPGGNNIALSRGTKEFAMLLNQDTRMAPDCISLLVERAERDPQVAVVEARQAPYELVKPYDPRTGETSWSSFGGALIRRAALKQAGLMEEWLFLYNEDVDLCWRFRAFGWRCIYEPKAVYEHFTGSPFEHSSPNTDFFHFRNGVYLRRVYSGSWRAWGWASYWYLRSSLSPYLHGQRGDALRKGLMDAWRSRAKLKEIARRTSRPDRKWLGFQRDLYGPKGIPA